MKKWRIKAVVCALLMIIAGANAHAEEVILADILLEGNRIVVSGSGAQAEGTTLTITQPGTYRVAGALDEGNIVVYAGENAAVRLILSGVDIVSSVQPSIQAVKTGKLEIELDADTKNSLRTGEAAQTDGALQDASAQTQQEKTAIHCVHAKGDLTILGEGELCVQGNLGGGLRASGKLRIESGTLQVSAVKDAVKGKDAVEILDGIISVISQADGIQSENGDGEGTGYVRISGGSIDVVSGEDGIQSETTLEITGGEISVVSGGGSGDAEGQSAAQKMMAAPPEGTEPDMPGDRPEGTGPDESKMPGRPRSMRSGRTEQSDLELEDQDSLHQKDADWDGFAGRSDRRGMVSDKMVRFGQNQSATEEDTAGTKGIKSGKDMIISGGTLNVDALDDALHAGGNLLVCGGEMELSSGDDGIHADADVSIQAGRVKVRSSYEALEALNVLISGGDIELNATDDGINAGSGMGMTPWSMRGSEQSEGVELPLLCITGGNVVVNAKGDGLDSNGSLSIEGGTVIVNGPENSGNGALDSGSESGGKCSISGGTVIAVGSDGMAESFDEGSAQGALYYRFGQMLAAGTMIQILDADGNTLIEHTLSKRASCVVFSCPDLSDGDQVEIVAGESRGNAIVGEDAPSGWGRGGGFRGGFGGGSGGRRSKGTDLPAAQ